MGKAFCAVDDIGSPSILVSIHVCLIRAHDEIIDPVAIDVARRRNTAACRIEL